MGGFKEKRDLVEYLALGGQVGLTIVGSILFCFWVGRLLDNWLHAHGIVLVIFILLGVVGGAVTVYHQITKLPKD